MALYAILKHYKFCFEKVYNSILDWYRHVLEELWWNSLSPEEQKYITEREEKRHREVVRSLAILSGSLAGIMEGRRLWKD